MTSASFDRLRNAISSYQESAVLAAAGELDLFTAIIERKNALDFDGITQALQTDPRGTAVLLDALSALGYLEKQPGDGIDNPRAVYSVIAEYVPWLDSRTPETFIPMIRHHACVQRAWVQLTWAVKDGMPPQKQPSIRGAEKDYDSFIMAMNSISRTLAPPSVEALKRAGLADLLPKNARFLDIGGASGTYTQAFLDAMPDWRGAVFDLPPGIARARERFTNITYKNRVELFEGDFYCDELPRGFDLAWLSAIIHQHGREESRELYKKIFAVLNSDGVIAVRDFVMDTTRTKPVAGTFFGVNMLVNTKTGRVYTFQEIEEDLKTAGFTDVKYAVPDETMSAIITARKP